MIRRILVIGGLALTVALGARFALVELSSELTARRWERREAELIGMAAFQPKVRRPWEVRFESLAERVAGSTRLDAVRSSPHRPELVPGDGEARRLDDLERLWIESLWGELTGLDGILAELRKLPQDALEWHGERQKLLVLRELTNALCARAWLAAEDGDAAAAGEAYADALRLVQATTDESSFATLTRFACDAITLDSLRAVLSLGTSPSVLGAAVEPLLAGWSYDAARAEHVIRRDLSYVRDSEEYVDGASPAAALLWFEPVEEALDLTRAPAPRVAELSSAHRSGTGADADERLWRLSVGTVYLHARHAQRNVASTALAVAAFREHNGEFPASLAELPGLARERMLDPHTGAELPYSRSGTGPDSEARIGPAEWGTRVDVWDEPERSLYVWSLR